MIMAQDSIGWKAFLFRSVHKIWGELQGNHLENMGKKTTGTGWISQLIQKVWTLQYNVRSNNNYLHRQHKGLNVQEEEVINKVIKEEFIIGKDALPPEYNGLFRGQIQTILKKDTMEKKLWIHRLWMGQDRIHKEQGLDPWYKDMIVSQALHKYCMRKKRKRG